MDANSTRGSILIGRRPPWRRRRWLLWAGLAGLLLLPLVAMRLGAGVQWTGLDFLLMGMLLAMVGAAFEVAMRVARSHAYVLAAGIAVAAAFVTVWANLAVGIIGNPSDPVNGVFYLVPLVALVGALLVRASAVGMVRAMTGAAIAQVVTCGLAFMEGELPAVAFSAGLLVMWLSAAAGFTHAGNVEAGSADAA